MLGIFLDIEANGLDSKRHCPIEIAFKVMDLNPWILKAEYQSVIKQTSEMWEKKDPASIAVNGFTWDEIVLGKEVFQVKDEIIDMLTRLNIRRGEAVFICQNPSFDRAFFNQIIEVYQQEELNWPYHWLDLASMYWAMRSCQAKQTGSQMPEKMSLSKNEIAKYYLLPPEGVRHRGMTGVDHLLLCYQAVLNV